MDASRAEVDAWIMEKYGPEGVQKGAVQDRATTLRLFDKCLAKDQLLPLLKGNPGPAFR